MRPIVTDEFACMVCLSFCYNIEPCKTGDPIEIPFWTVDSGWPREPCVRRRFRSPHAKGQFWGERYLQGRLKEQLNEQEWQFSYNGIRALEKRRTKCFSVAGNYVWRWQIWCIVFVFVGLRTIWTPLVFVCLSVKIVHDVESPTFFLMQISTMTG